MRFSKLPQQLTLGLLLASLNLAPTLPALAQIAGAGPLPTSPARLCRVASEAANPRLDYSLRQVLGQATGCSPAELRSAHPDLRFRQGRAGTTVLVRVMARDVAALLPTLQALGFEVTGSAPQLHFVEGNLPVRQLGAMSALQSQGLLGVVAASAAAGNVGLVTSQADYVLEADRARATLPRQITGSGVRVGVLSSSFNRLGGAAADVASGDLPVVTVLSEYMGTDSTTDEGRAMCQLVHDLAPSADLAFSTAEGGEAAFAQHIRDLADPSKGNCRVIVDDYRYFGEPMFQDGVIAVS